MLWPDWKIRLHGPGIIKPFDASLIQPSSIDVTLDSSFYVATARAKFRAIDLRDDLSAQFKKVVVNEGEGFLLTPRSFVLASTFEHVEVPNDIACRYEGKSSLGRIGLFTHVTAGFIDPGFKGHITLELFNAAPYSIRLMPGMKIGQLCFIEMLGAPDKAYGADGVGSHYQGQRGPTPSRIHEKSTIKNVY